MKKIILLSAALLLFSKNNFAQILNDSLLGNKNEIGIDLLPVTRILSDENFINHNNKVSILYKRQIKPSLYFRLSASSRLPLSNYGPTTSFNVKTNFPETRINSGLEYRWGKKNLRYFTGMDLGLLYSKETTSYQDSRYSTESSFSTTKKGISVNPFFGMQYHFSKKFFFSTQIGPEVGYIFGSQKSMQNRPIVVSPKFREFNLNGGILGNFSLFYKF